MGWSMGTGITIKILEQNLDNRVCVVEITDDGSVLAKGNIGLELNPDGTANTNWIIHTTKEIVLTRRNINDTQASIDRLTSTINSEE
jgi:hypothetical protein